MQKHPVQLNPTPTTTIINIIRTYIQMINKYIYQDKYNFRLVLYNAAVRAATVVTAASVKMEKSHVGWMGVKIKKVPHFFYIHAHTQYNI